MTQATDTADREELRWWQWHLGDRMARHQHPGQDVIDCSWPQCAWHGFRPGDDNLIDSLPEPALRSVALSHLDGIGAAEGGGRFVYERDVLPADVDLEG